MYSPHHQHHIKIPTYVTAQNHMMKLNAEDVVRSILTNGFVGRKLQVTEKGDHAVNCHGLSGKPSYYTVLSNSFQTDSKITLLLVAKNSYH